MNTETELTRQQLQAISDYLTLQYGTMLYMRLGYLMVVLALVSAIFGARRLSMFFFFLVGAFSFLVPSPFTLLLAPVIIALSIAGGIVFTIQRRRQRLRAIAQDRAAAVPPAA